MARPSDESAGGGEWGRIGKIRLIRRPKKIIKKVGGPEPTKAKSPANWGDVDGGGGQKRRKVPSHKHTQKIVRRPESRKELRMNKNELEVKKGNKGTGGKRVAKGRNQRKRTGKNHN